MVKNQQIQNSNQSFTKLGLFTLDFEYDKTIQQVKHEVRVRTDKNTQG
jgi:hypothetical protein